jgi:hypothetical protein
VREDTAEMADRGSISIPCNPDAAPSLFTATKEQPGLEMKAVKEPAEVIVNRSH